jgi:hypothetical protein
VNYSLFSIRHSLSGSSDMSAPIYDPNLLAFHQQHGNGAVNNVHNPVPGPQHIQPTLQEPSVQPGANPGFQLTGGPQIGDFSGQHPICPTVSPAKAEQKYREPRGVGNVRSSTGVQLALCTYIVCLLGARDALHTVSPERPAMHRCSRHEGQSTQDVLRMRRHQSSLQTC